LGGFPDGLVTIGDHQVEIPHGGEEVEVSVALVSTTRVVEGVEGAVAVEELGGLVDDEAAEALVENRGGFVEKGLVGGAGKKVVAVPGQAVAVGGVAGERFDEGCLQGGAGIDVGELVAGCGGPEGVRIEGAVGVVPDGVEAAEIFVGGWGEEDDAGGGGAVVGLASEVLEEGVEAVDEGLDSLRAGEGFVVAEGGDDEVRLEVEEVLIEVAEVVGTGLEVDLVGGPGEVADGELVPGEALVKEGFEVALAAFVVEEEVADEGDAGLGLDGEGEGCLDRGCLVGAEGGVEVDVKFGEGGVLRGGWACWRRCFSRLV